jgi:ABC-type lipoprotein release transport system permease subunit
MFFTDAIKREASIILKEAPEIVVQRMVAGRHDLFPARDVDKVKAIRGVSSAEGRLWGYYFDPVVRANYTLIVPNDAPIATGKITIGAGVSRARLVFPGDTMFFRAHDGSQFKLVIAGVLSSESELVSSDLILISEPDFRSLFGLSPDYVTDVTVKVLNPAELLTIATKITQILPASRPILRDEMRRTYDSVFSWRGGMMVVILSAAVLAFIIFAWDKASGLSAEERREIGILKAVGWETSDVILMKFWEGSVVSVSALLLGVSLAYVHVFFTSSVVFEPALKGWSSLYPEFKLVPFIDPGQLATLFFLTVVPYTVSTIVPSWRAATIDPDAAMRQS